MGRVHARIDTGQDHRPELGKQDIFAALKDLAKSWLRSRRIDVRIMTFSIDGPVDRADQGISPMAMGLNGVGPT